MDYYWNKLSEGGSEQPCGWLKDKFGLSWQIVLIVLPKLLDPGNQDKANKVMQELMKMKKLDIAKLEEAGKEQ